MTQKHSKRRRLQYRFEQFMSKGGSSIFISLLIVFIASFLAIVGLRFLLYLIIEPDSYNTTTAGSFWEHIWYTFLQMTDPGNMYQDSMTKGADGWMRISTIVAGFVGVILLSMLIAFITAALEKQMYEFRKGRGQVLEEGQTLILGWNERVIDIIRELVIANESEESASIVILAKKSKEEMDDQIFKSISDLGNVKVVTTSGDTANLHELKRVNTTEAKSIIIMATCEDLASDSEKLKSDIEAIKTVLALNAVYENKLDVPVITEIFNDQKREILEFMGNDNIIALDNWDIMGKLLVQTSLTSGLVIVYNEILSFDLSEIYYYNDPLWEGIKFNELIYHFEDGIPLGIYTPDGDIKLRPENDYAMKAEDEILILAEDDSTIDFNPKPNIAPSDSIQLNHFVLDKFTKRVLILGWHSLGKIFVSESDDYLMDGSVFDIMIENPTEDFKQMVHELDVKFTNIKLNIIDANSMDYNQLKEAKPFDYDTILILASRFETTDSESMDSDTLLVSLMLNKIGDEIDTPKQTKILSQILNSENQDLILQTDVDDFIISNKLITMILAQLSEEPRMRKFYDDIFQEDGSEIYIKPAWLYFDKDTFPVERTFADIIKVAQLREEICLGIRYAKDAQNPEANFGVKLNLPKDKKVTLTKADFLIVLSEDEL